METMIKKKKAIKAKKPAKKKASKYSNLPDLSNDPYFVKKAEKSKEMLIKAGLLKP